MITARDLHALAIWMVDEHGPDALRLASLAIAELEEAHEAESASAWTALRSVVADIIGGKIDPQARPTVH